MFVLALYLQIIYFSSTLFENEKKNSKNEF